MSRLASCGGRRLRRSRRGRKRPRSWPSRCGPSRAASLSVRLRNGTSRSTRTWTCSTALATRRLLGGVLSPLPRGRWTSTRATRRSSS
eukprot:14701325-Heterocapsa_arctica.AAC.1